MGLITATRLIALPSGSPPPADAAIPGNFPTATADQGTVTIGSTTYDLTPLDPTLTYNLYLIWPGTPVPADAILLPAT